MGAVGRVDAGAFLGALGGLLSMSRPCASVGSCRAGPVVEGAGSPCGRGLVQEFCGKPRLMPPWLGSSQRLVTTLPRVKKWTPSVPWAWLSPKSELFQPPKE